MDDNAAVFILPLSDAAKKLLAAEIVAGFLFRSPKVFFDSRLGGHASMVDTRKPENFLPQHACTTRENILDGVI